MPDPNRPPILTGCASSHCDDERTKAVSHFTVFVESRLVRETKANKGDLGFAVVSVKCWAESSEAAEDMAVFFVQELAGGFVNGKIEVLATDPDQPPETDSYGPETAPYGYDLTIKSFDVEATQ